MSITLRYGIAVAASVLIGTAIFLPTTSPRKQVKPQDIAYLWEAVAERKMVVPARISAAYTNIIGTRTNIYTYQLSTVSTNTIVYSNIVWKTDTGVTNRYWKSVATPNIANTNEGTMVAYDTFDRWNCVSNVFISTGQYFVAWVPIQTPAVRLFESVHSNYTVATSYGTYSGTYAWDTNSTRTNLRWKSGDKTLTRVLEDYAYNWGGPEGWDLYQYPTDLQYTWILNAGNGISIQKSAKALDGGALTGPCRWQTGWDEVPDPVTVTGTGPLLSSTPFLTYVGFSYTNVPNLVTRLNSGNSYGAETMSLSAIDEAIYGLIPNFIDTSVKTSGTYNAYFSTVRYSNTVTTLPALTVKKAFELAGVGTNYIYQYYGVARTNRWFTWPPPTTNQYYNHIAYLFAWGVVLEDAYRGGIPTNALYERYKVLQILAETQEPLQSINTNVVITTTTKNRWGEMSYFAGYGSMFHEKDSVMNPADVMAFMEYPPESDFDFTKDWISGTNFSRSHTSTFVWDEAIGAAQTTTTQSYTNSFAEIYAASYYIFLRGYDFRLNYYMVNSEGNPNSPYSSYAGAGGGTYYSIDNLINVKSPKVWRAGVPAATGVEADFDFYFRYGTASMNTPYGVFGSSSTSSCSLAYSTTDMAQNDVIYTPAPTPVDYPELKLHFIYTNSVTDNYYQKDWRGENQLPWEVYYQTQANFSVSAMKGPVVSKWKFQYCAP